MNAQSPHVSVTFDAMRRGYSLLEVLVAMALIAILASIAVTSFSRQQLRSRRIEATVALLNVAVEQERAYASDQSYRASLTAAPPAGLGLRDTTEHGAYRIELKTSEAGDTFEVIATAIGTQAADQHCAEFRLDATGRRGATNADCWR
jgi:type IV pilus assembly protein PilE